MGFMGKKSILKFKIIKKVWMNRKDYKFLDFKFKVAGSYFGENTTSFEIFVYNCDVLILKLLVYEEETKEDERFLFKVIYFNPKTDNDCFSINHIIAVCSEDTISRCKYKDMGNAEIIKNQFIFRKMERKL